MTSINTASPLFNDNELSKILNELKVKVKEDHPETKSSTSPEDRSPQPPQTATPPTEGNNLDNRSVEDILRENFKID